MKAGLNLFSIRNLIQTEEQFAQTADKLKKMGYDYIQYSGGPFEPEMIKRVSQNSGLDVVLTHVAMDRVINDTQKLMDEHALFNCKNIGIGLMPADIIRDEKKCKETVAQLNKAGEFMARNGFKFFYHNHHIEFFKHNGQTVFDYMIENAPYINFTADTYWLQYGGVNVLEYLEKLKGRIECVHLKDYGIFEKDDWFEPKFTPVGDGTIDFKTIVPKMKEWGVKYFLVEQDNAADLPDPLAPIERSIKYIKAEL